MAFRVLCVPRRCGVFPLTGFDSRRYGWKEIPGSSHDWLRHRLLDLPAGLSMLDLGAGAGHLGLAVRQHFARLTGVEADPAAASEASQIYDQWLTGPIEASLPLRPDHDVVVCADILEHLVAPEEALSLIARWLRPGGLLLVSLPNIANVTVRFSLLAGRFRYADRGILDRTHLRFYTRRSGRALLEEQGWRIDRITATAMPLELAVPILGRAPLAAPVRAAASTAAVLWPGLFGYQFLFEARRR